MRILTVLTYYRPHTSGLTIYAERLAKALVRLGHQVTVLTSRYDSKLPTRENVDGVEIIRVPVMMRINKGVVMPSFGLYASRLVKSHDIIHLHLPQFDAAGVALRGRLLKKPTVITYHCDLLLPPNILNRAVNNVIHMMNHLAAKFTHSIITYTQDYAEHSPFLKHYLKKVKFILPPVEVNEVTPAQISDFRTKTNPKGRFPIIGMAARFATEKGVEVLLNALPNILKVFPHAQVQFAGPHEHILGEEDYAKKLAPLIGHYENEGHWQFLGVLNPQTMATYYKNIDLLVLPSLNSTEAFGLVQIEAMLNEVPCIASDLPGVRQPIIMHQMGEIIPIGDSEALAQATIKILQNIKAYRTQKEKIQPAYLPETTARSYERIFLEIRDQLIS